MELITCVIALLSLLVTYIVYHNNMIADVVVYAKADLARPSAINLVIHNIGKGIARNVQFHTTEGIPEHANGILKLINPRKIYSSGAFVRGIPFLFPDEKLIYSWGQLGGLKEALSSQPLKIKITFNSKLPMQLWTRKIVNVVEIDVLSLEGVNIGEPSIHIEIKSILKDISKSIRSLK